MYSGFGRFTLDKKGALSRNYRSWLRRTADNRILRSMDLSPHYIILDLLLNTPVFTGFHKVHTEQMQAGTTSSASSGEKCVRQSQRPVVFG